jgi:polyphenol oxidase
MRLIDQDGMFPHYHFEIFDPFKNKLLRHAFFTREVLAENRELIKDYFRVPLIYEVNQVHGNNVWVLEEMEFASQTVSIIDDALPRVVADALITNKPGRAILVKVADCMPVFILDPKTPAIGLVHSGWQGTVQNVIGATITKMVDVYGSKPRDLIVGIGPSIGPCCYTRPNYHDELPPHFYQYMRKGDILDLWAAGKDQLLETGVPASHIEVAELCTKCHNDKFSSYRVEGSNVKNMAGVMKLL